MTFFTMKRREFLRLSGAGALALGAPFPLRHGLSTLSRAPKPGPILVVIYLRGGQDPLNVVVPYKDENYYKIRPTIAIPAGKTEGEASVLPLDKKFGLHPALAPLVPLFKSKRFAPILAVGSPHPTRSHFDAQDFMEYAAPGIRTIRQGWLNRYLEATANRNGKDSELRALAFQGLLPRSLRGPYPVLAAGGRSADAKVLDLFGELYGEGEDAGAMGGDPGAGGMRKREDETDKVLETGRATVTTLRRLQEVLAKAPPSRVRYPRGVLGSKLEGIARVIRAGVPLEVACADWNGWDHHAREGGLDGTMNRMLTELGGSLRAFLEDLGPHADRTLVLTMTEFGRTARENGNTGTDHGHAGLMLAVGGKIKGGRILGKWPGLDEKSLYQGRDLAVTTDFRDVFAEVLRKHMGWRRMPRDFFPEYRPGRGPGLCS